MSLRLFCLPYAGGSARIYEDWAKELPSTVDIVPLELPGRGTRFREGPQDTLEPVVADLVDRIIPHAHEPFAILGYSYGALIGFEAAVRLQQRGTPPRKLIVAAARAAVCTPHGFPASELPDEEFLQRIKEMDGTPGDLLDNDEFMQIMLPVLRADFTVADRYLYEPGPLLDAPITAFGGADDPSVTWESVQAWQRCTSKPTTTYRIPGNHFFLHSERKPFLSTLAHELRSAL